MNTKEEQYKVCILTAGVGSPIGQWTDHINKGIMPINNKAVISYIIEKFSPDIEIVIAIGHKKDTITDYLALAYPDRSFTYVEVDKYSGPGSGPGYSLLACKEHLNTPFIFCTSDTIVLEDIPVPNENWIGIAPVHETEPYCTVKIKNNLVVQLDDKVKCSNKFAFIGLAGIKDHKAFFSALEQTEELRNNERQMVDGFNGLLEHKLVPTGFTWFDTDSENNYVDTDRHFSGRERKFDFRKEDEFLYFVNDRVIKFFSDKGIAKKRHQRSETVLKGLTPVMEGYRGSFYSYLLVPGQTVYSVLNVKVASDFLSWAQEKLWQPKQLSTAEQGDFQKACTDFYHTKTRKRLEMYFSKEDAMTEPRFINGLEIPGTKELLNQVDWEYITDGTPSNFHGDLQFDNVLVRKNTKLNTNEFLLLDWRQDFGGLTEYGDLYYDLAKLYGGLTLSYPLIKDGMFSCEISDDQANYYYYIKSDLVEVREYYERFIIKNNYDLKKVKLIAALIFLNMAPLHNSPFDHLLLALGRSKLSNLINV